MSNSKKQKITDEDIQAYLLGEGTAEKLAKIQKIDKAKSSSLTNKELKIKQTLESFRQVDSLFSVAIDESIGIPPHLLKQINETLYPTEQSVKKNILEQAVTYVQGQFNFGSIFAGGVVGAFATFAFLNVSPTLMVGMDQDTIEPAYRSAMNSKETLMEISPQLKEDINWQVTNEFAYKFVIFGTSDIQRDGRIAAVGETFDLKILPLKNGLVSINYINSDGKKQVVLDNEPLIKGVEFRLSNDKLQGKRPKFSLPTGIDKMVLIHQNKVVETIEIEVK